MQNVISAVSSAISGSPPVGGSASPDIVHLRQTPTSHQLIVKGQPKLLLAGELQNSSLSSAAYMRTVWQKLKETNYNTLLGCVTWEDIEPREGELHFDELDQILVDARAHGLHLILLWFGSYKNGVSTYTPAWVKKDHKRFPRAKLNKAGESGTETTEVISLFGGDGNQADAKAFAALLKHLKQVDGAHSTVLMVQVENETGLLGDSRDRSTLANKKFSEPVPADLIEFLQSAGNDSLHRDLKKNLQHFYKYAESSENTPSGTWEQVFGASKQTDELFMAYHYAHYLDKVAAAGKAEYPIPLYSNVWQNYNHEEDDEPSFPIVVGGGNNPGVYPSGGAVTTTLDIWRKFAPHLDFIAPDIYLNNYVNSCSNYRHNNNTLFIPEQRRDEYGARRSWVAFGSYQAIGTSPFGVDTLEPADSAYTRHYGLLDSVSTLILEAQTRPNGSFGFFFDEIAADGTDPSPPQTVGFGNYKLTIERCFVFGKADTGSGIVIHYPPGHPSNPSPSTDDVFLLVGWGFHVVFTSKSAKATFTGILEFEEKQVVDRTTGQLKTLRKLNGDESRSGKFAMMPNENPDYGGFPISVTIPARTMVARVIPYTLEEDE